MYIIQEFQTNNSTTAVVPPAVYTDANQAESDYHMRLGAAAISSVELHTVAMYDEYGNLIKHEWYNHLTE